jgi:hippurate hydrolase
MDTEKKSLLYSSDSEALDDTALLEEIVAGIGDIQQIRRDIHAHPELCFDEKRTAQLVADKLRSWGIQIRTGLGKTGVVGVIKAGNSERAIGLRADMDALPVQERNQFEHRSKYPGKMHACGHDGHTAMLLAAARYLARHSHFDGSVYLIFQPAEEDGGGARAMIEDGLFKEFPMQAVFGMHNWPGLPAGQFAVSAGPVMASSNTFRLRIRGKGCHAALPHTGLDPVPVAAQIILALQTVLTRNAKPLDAGVISITQLHAGETNNVISDCCELAGTVRTFSLELLNLIEQRMADLAEHICRAHGMTSEFEFNRDYPATVNHGWAAELSRQVMVDLVGEHRVVDQEPTMGAEDFSFMLQQLPGCYCFIGNGGNGSMSVGRATELCMLHNPGYDFNDDILPLGATYWVKLVEAYFAAK